MANALLAREVLTTVNAVTTSKKMTTLWNSFKVIFLRVVRKCADSTIKTEVRVMRVKITLACTECKQRNYNMTKEKKNHPDRMETSKYCRFCKKHTLHKETK